MVDTLLPLSCFPTLSIIVSRPLNDKLGLSLIRIIIIIKRDSFFSENQILYLTSTSSESDNICHKEALISQSLYRCFWKRKNFTFKEEKHDYQNFNS